jgi:hypothetical protein
MVQVGDNPPSRSFLFEDVAAPQHQHLFSVDFRCRSGISKERFPVQKYMSVGPPAWMIVA